MNSNVIAFIYIYYNQHEKFVQISAIRSFTKNLLKFQGLLVKKLWVSSEILKIRILETKVNIQRNLKSNGKFIYKFLTMAYLYQFVVFFYA